MYFVPSVSYYPQNKQVQSTKVDETMNPSLSADSLNDLTASLRQANEEFTRHYSGETGRRQPVHTVYGGAHLFKADSAKRLGSLARRSLDQFAPDFLTFARALDLTGAHELPDTSDEAAELVSFLKNEPEKARKEKKTAWLAYTIYRRVVDKLQREPVEDVARVLSRYVSGIVVRTYAQKALEDLAAAIEVMVFPKTMLQYGELLEPDAIVVLKARIDRREDTPKLIAMEISRPEINIDGASALTLRVKAPVLTEQRVEKLRDLLRAHPGQSPVFVRVVGPEKETVLRLGDEFRCDTRNGLYAELRVLFGADCIA